MKGKFIVIEGLEGAGKSSAHQSVVRVLHELAIQDVVFYASLVEHHWQRNYVISSNMKPKNP